MSIAHHAYSSTAAPPIKATDVPPLPRTAEAAIAPRPRHRVRQAVSTSAVVAAFVGMAIWGHQTEWKFIDGNSSLEGSEKASTWCEEHSVPEEICIECQSQDQSPLNDFGWCSEHGVAQCPLHHPEVSQLKKPATVESADLERAQRALALLPRAENNRRCLLHRHRIQFASAEAVDKAGIDIFRVQRSPIVEAISANVEIVYDQTQLAHLASRAAGTVWKVLKQVGDKVHEGELLALVDAAEVGRTKSLFLEALAELRLQNTLLDRLRPLKENGTIAGRKFTESQAAVQAAEIKLRTARQALVNLGLPIDPKEYDGMELSDIARRIERLGLPDEIAGVDAQSLSSNLLPIRASLEGVVVERDTVPGEVITTDTRLLTVANTRRMWLMLNVRQEDISSVDLNQTVRFRPTGDGKGPEVVGPITWINTAVDAATRTVQVRAELTNTDGKLRSNTFGTGRIVLRDEPDAIVVPSESVHWDGCCNVVFVRDKDYFEPNSPKFFHVRKVRLGVEQDGLTEII
ncbi:MAG: efflux RND transporter periplasmic adaptor subunit, partial [Pirellulales bacterium]|nr:efflux RND transporter periplasmic adaptor subunit [Pirellulales bacterium]